MKTANGQPKTTFHWDPKLKRHVEIPWEPDKFRRKLNSRGHLWVAYNYKMQMELALTTKSAILAVQAELYRLQYRSWSKKDPVVFNCSAVAGFERHAVATALQALEKQGWVSVQREKGRAPKVTVLRGFHTQE